MTKILKIAAANNIIYALRSDGQIYAGEIGDSKWIQMAPIPQDDAPETTSDPMIFLPDGQSVRASLIGIVQTHKEGTFPNGTFYLPGVRITCKGTEQQPGTVLVVNCATWNGTLELAESINAQLGKRKGES